MLNTIPQDPSSVMRFVDGADERQLMSMVSSKNPYSFMALAKLQSIRDAKMKEQAGQPMPPPMSEQIPQQLAQLASGQQPQQQPMQQPMQPPMQQPMQPQQPQGIASIGGEPNGAGGGMVSFTDGGGVRRFAEPNDGGNVRHFQTGSPGVVTDDTESSAGILGRNSLEFIRSIPSPIKAAADAIPSLAGTPEQKERSLQIQKKRLGLQNAIRELSPGTFEQLTSQERAQRNKALDYYTNELININKPTATTAIKSSKLSPEQTDSVQYGPLATTNSGAVDKKTPDVGAGDASGSDAGLAALRGQAAGMAKDAQKQLAPQYEAQNRALSNTIKVMTDAQKERDAVNTPEKFAATQGKQEERDKLQADRLAKLEQTTPDPYAKTANSLASLGKELGRDKENAPYQAMLSAAFKLMGNRSPYFMTALGESGAAGLTDYNQIKDANKKQEMALMSAESSLSAAQDARKRGMNSEANSYMKEFYDRKKEAFNFEVASVNAKTMGALQLAGLEEKRPQLEINQIKDTYLIRSDLLKHNLDVYKAGIEGAKLGMTAIPVEAKVALFLAKRPDLKDAVNSEQDRSRFAKNLESINKNPLFSTLPDEERIAMAINEVIKGRAAFPSSGPSNRGKLGIDASGKLAWQPQ
jgi:hypothetical protein